MKFFINYIRYLTTLVNFIRLKNETYLTREDYGQICRVNHSCIKLHHPI